jgi:hypothetical protein
VGREGLAKDEIIEFQTDPQLFANVASVQASAPPPELSSPGPQPARNLAKSDLARRLRASSSVPVSREASLTARRAATQSPKQKRPTPAEPPCDERNSVASPICNDVSLTALDGQLTVFERQSVYYADAAKRDTLKQSRLHFEREREQCRTKTCVRDTIVRRLTHVANIMSNKGGSNPLDSRGASRLSQHPTPSR